jgi:cob(I)alamin adenosyltransferase
MPKTPVFYTRAGDDGTTAIYGQKERIPKHHLRPEAYGAIDEAQAMLGLLRAGVCQSRTREIIIRVERDLYLIMGQMAVADTVKLPARPIDQTDVDWLEAATSEIGEATGGFTDFVLPGDTVSGAQAHVARTIIRRAERHVSRLHHAGDLNNIAILRYLNRLSSLLFVLALFEDQLGGVKLPTHAKNVKD